MHRGRKKRLVEKGIDVKGGREGPDLMEYPNFGYGS